MATADANVTVAVDATSAVVTPKVSKGYSTYLGTVLTILSAIGALVAAAQSNDTATVTAGASGLLIALTTIGGRMAQSVALARQVAQAAQPFVAALAQPPAPAPATVVVNASPDRATATVTPSAPLEDPEVDQIDDDILPSDDEEFAAPPDLSEPPETAVHPEGDGDVHPDVPR